MKRGVQKINMYEILCSIHNYTKFSGFPYSFYDMAQSALDCGMDAVFSSDRNIYPAGHDQYFYRNEKRLLVVCGEELFDPLDDKAPHYLSLGINREQFQKKQGNPQDEIRVLLKKEQNNHSFRHFELINAEDLLQGIQKGQHIFRENIQFYDDLIQTEQRFLALAGTCSLQHRGKFTYPELFSTVCNHVLSEESLTGDFDHDKLLILKCLKSGQLFIGLDGLADTKGFRFSAEGSNQEAAAWPGNTIYLKNSITLKVNIPESCNCRLIRNRSVIKEWEQCRQVPFTIYEPGVYRVECRINLRRNLYDWIFSNPIFVVKG